MYQKEKWNREQYRRKPRSAQPDRPFPVFQQEDPSGTDTYQEEN